MLLIYLNARHHYWNRDKEHNTVILMTLKNSLKLVVGAASLKTYLTRITLFLKDTQEKFAYALNEYIK